jgi:hypothetical protein
MDVEVAEDIELAERFDSLRDHFDAQGQACGDDSFYNYPADMIIVDVADQPHVEFDVIRFKIGEQSAS